LVFEKYLEDLSVEDQKLLTNENEELVDTISKFPKPQSLSERLQLEETVECVRCREAKFRSNFPRLNEEFRTESVEQVMTNIPPNSNLVYIINGQDFPMSIDDQIFKYTSSKSVKFVITKSDLLFKTNALSLKYGLTFIQDYLYTKFQVPRENVFITSGKTDWNTKDLVKFIDNNSYIIGHVNSGKSSIIKSLLFQIKRQEMSRPKKLSKRELTKLQKQQDRMINDESTNVGNARKSRKDKREEKLLKQRLGPGVSYVPGFTRGFIEVVLGDQYDANSKVIYDVPGFSFLNTNNDICDLISTTKLKLLTKGVKTFDHGFYYSNYNTIKGNQCLTFGGINFLIPPPDSIYQIRNCINAQYEIFKSFNTATDISTKLEQYPSFIGKFLTHHTKNSIKELRRFIIPPHYGPIDIVFQNIGHINLTPTGSKQNNQPMILYLPKGVEAIIRQPITNYIAKSFTGKDANRNPLKKENYASKSTFALRRYNSKELFFSRLIPSEKSENETLQTEMDYQAISRWISIAKGRNIEFNDRTVIKENNRYEYWVE
jgi:ribosome biogenesis GTPase A